MAIWRMTPIGGPETVDLMVPAEEIAVLGFDGRKRRVSGSSYAAARVTALAACLLAAHSEWSTSDLKAAIFAEAQKTTGSDRTAQGLIAESVFGALGACRKEPLALADP